MIYFNETFRSFVMVQYKAMEKGPKEPEFRWKAGDQFSDELERMDVMAAELERISDDEAADGFRLHQDPFYLKFCPRVAFNPDDRGLFNGMYLPRSLCHRLVKAGGLKGARNGNVLTYSNAGRRFQNRDFISLVANSWIGTTIPQSESIERMIKEVLSDGRAVTYAVKRGNPPDPSGEITRVHDLGPVQQKNAATKKAQVRVTTSR